MALPIFPRPGVVAFAYDERPTGQQNVLIGTTAAYWADQLDCPSLIQARGVRVPAEYLHVGGVEYREARTTLAFAREVGAWARERHLLSILIVAQYPHCTRCERDVLRCVREQGMNLRVQRVPPQPLVPSLGDPAANDLPALRERSHPRSYTLAGVTYELALRAIPWQLYARLSGSA